MDSFLSSSQNFVRALKASADPPNLGGPSKIEIARAAWDQKSFYAPRKAEVIVGFILDCFVRSHETHSITDTASWQLLLDVILPSHLTKSDSWLAPLVSRTPFTRIVIQLFESVQNAANDDSQHTRIVSECITILWPFCAPKVSTELLLECFSASLRLCGKRQPLDQHISHLIMKVAVSFHRSFSTSTAKKKTFTSFIQTHLKDWLLSLDYLQSSPNYSTLFESLYTPGVECFLNIDILRDNKTENTIFSAFENFTPEIIMPVLPRVFLSYIQTLRKKRNAIFGLGSSQKTDFLEEYREASLQFFASCQHILNEATQKDQSWRANALLLDVVNQENLFSGRHLETEKLFNGIVNSAVVELTANIQVTLEPVIHCLSSLAQIDYRLIEGVIPNILSQLILIPDTVTPALELLDIVLQFHVKTRTVPLYIDTLMSIDFRETLNGHDFLRVFERICNSACLHPSHLDHLGKCVHEFLPLIQTITVVRSVTERIQNLLEQYHRFSRSMDEESPRKKRKVDNDSADNDVTKATTLAFSTAAIFTSVVLSSFSASSVPKESQPELETLLTSFSSKVVLHSLSRMVKGVSKTNRTSSWDDEVVMRGNLRLRYALSLGLERSPSITINVECPSKLTQRLFESIDKIMLPELQLEILRTLFQCAPVGQQPALLDVTLRILETDEPPEMINVLHMVIQRWFPLIDLHASKAQLERFVVLLVNIQTRSGENAMKILMNQALSSAEFWELSEVRIILLAFIEQSISDICNWTTATLHEKEVVHSVFNILSFIPTEYLSRTLRLSLVKRAILFDQTMTSMNDAGLLHTLRVCVSRSISSADLSDNLMGDLAVYLQRLHNAEVNVESFLQTTELIRLLLKNLFKSNDSKEIGQLIQHYSDGLQSSHFSPLNPWARSFEIVVELLMKGYPMKSFSNSVQDKFKELYDALHQSLLPSLVELMNKPSALKVTQARGLLEGWQRVLKLGRWLGITDIAVFGENIDQLFAFAKLSGDENAGSIVFGVLLEEFNFCAVNLQPQRFEIVVAAYVLLAKDRPVASLSSIDSSISSLCPTLSVDIFKHGMDFIVASLKCAKEEDSGALVHVLSILIQESPQNTFHMVQIFVTESINIFNDREIFTDKIRLPALRLLLQRCRDRPATLRLADISGIWLFIAKSCADAETHDPTTSAETFHCIVSITTTLVRLRRDLVLLTIPHLGVVLRYLIQSMRSPRLNLGPKQSAVVSRGLPPWINIQDPLSAEEAKALSRLLESLNTKSIIRKLTTSTAAPPKAESLAKPFSKHAAYVIKAYVKSLNDPLCAIPAVVRKELQPGLYALCGMMNDFGRDALMASATDAGEKAIVKALWREYEKQRYVGKG